MVRLALGLVVAVSLTAAGFSVAGTDATFDGQTRTPAVVSLASVGPPSALSVQPVGSDVALTWSAGTNGTGYEVRSGGTCDGLTVVAEPAGTSYTDTPAVSPGAPRCYGVVTTWGSWTSMSGNPATVVQVGFVATSVSMANGACGTSGVLDCGDTFVVRFNQPADAIAVVAVCTDAVAGAIVVGCETNRGTLHGGTVDVDARYDATSAWSNDNRTLTVTVGTRTEGASAPVIGADAWTLTPAGLVSATGAVAVCATAGDCRPTTSTLP